MAKRHLQILTLAMAMVSGACAGDGKSEKSNTSAEAPTTETTALSRPESHPNDSLKPAQMPENQTAKKKSEPSEPPVAEKKMPPAEAPAAKKTESEKKENTPEKRTPKDIPEGFTELVTLDKSIRLDIRYATTDNFTKAKIYDCPRCLLRPEAAEAVVEAHKALKKKGLTLKMFDCYRPRPYQQRLWDKVPNPDYVTPPSKGSMHGRGLAVDLTIVDESGKELDMGTEYDFFGEKAHTDYTNLPPGVLENRKLLRETMEAVGFKGIRTEWWHFSFQKKDYPLSEAVWKCE